MTKPNPRSQSCNSTGALEKNISVNKNPLSWETGFFTLPSSSCIFLLCELQGDLDAPGIQISDQCMDQYPSVGLG